MWTAFSFNDKNYYFHFGYDKGTLNICLTDLITSWKEVITDEIITERFKVCNSVDADVEADKIVQIFLTDLNPESNSTVITVKHDGKLCNLSLTNEAKDLSYDFILSTTLPEEFMKDITLPLLLIIRELTDRQNKLKQLLKEKDDEITEYQLEGGKLFRRYMETQKFDENQFVGECSKTTESNLMTSLCNIKCVFNEEVNSIYASAVKASQIHMEKTANSTPVLKEETSPSEPCDKKEKNLKWEIGPQNTKRFKNSKTKIRL